MLTEVYVGVGSNLSNPLAQVKHAIKTLAEHQYCLETESSRLYGSKPVGPQDQPDYVNAVVKFHTPLRPHDLLDLLQSIENEQGRVRNRKWGERTLDLDLLLYGQAQICSPRLTVPHPHMQERSFVLHPLVELNPDLQLPTGQSLQQLANQVEFDLSPVKNGN